MKNKGCARWTVLLGMLALLLICIAAAGLVYFQARASAVNSRPLVLIHAPVNHDQVHVGDGVLVHATARADNGLRRIELWADGVFVDARDVADAPSTLVFSGSWIPRAAGNHVLIVRAVAADGTAGQAAVTVEALAQEGADAGIHTVEEGETLETIAAEEGTTPEELAAANPDLGPGGPVPGDDLTVPDDEPPAPGGAPAEPPPGSDPPIPEDNPPGLAPLDVPLLGPLHTFPFGAGEPLGLRVEFLGLSTAASYERLHCYVGYGDIPPRWFPDADGDQTTDESFEIVSAGAGGGTMWNMAGLSGDSMPVFSWPRNRDLPISVSCVGIVGGGTDSVELGRWEDSIEPERWTGIHIGGGAAGMYEFAFRITRSDSGHGVPLYLDPDMTPPTNARLDDRRISLRWDYNPRPDEEPIDGFRVYLNGSLQWVEPADSRESMLPYEWFNPPCGAAYTFTVTAYRVGLPDGPESLPGIAVLRQPDEDCAREVMITFLTLETFDLGGDGSHEDREGDVGPPYGYFFANEQQITFDGGALGSGGSLDRANGFRHNTAYDLGELAADSSWRFSGGPPVALLAAVPEGGAFEFGFRIMDEDSGRCRDSDDPGCDDLICEGLSMIYEENSAANELDEHHEGSLTSENGRCRVTFQWGPAAGSPVGSGAEGGEPLPWLSLEEIEIDDDNGRVRLHIRNTGTATWPGRDLNIELQNREGVSLGVYTWENFILEAGQRATLEHPDMRLAAPPFDACVLIDPYNEVVEGPERSGALFHYPICPPTPDLTITEARFEPAGGAAGQIRVTIRNVGSERLENRAIEIQTYLPDGTPLYIGGSYPNITLERFQTITLNFGGVSESIRRQMRAGYRVVVNPQGRLYESNHDNNAFDIPPVVPVAVTAISATGVPEFEDLLYRFTVSILSGTSRREIANWDIAPSGVDTGGGIFIPEALFFDFSTGSFELMGDELLEVVVTADPREGDYARLRSTNTFSAAEIRASEADYRSSTGCEGHFGMRPAFVPTFRSLPGPESGNIATFVFAICGPMR